MAIQTGLRGVGGRAAILSASNRRPAEGLLLRGLLLRQRHAGGLGRVSMNATATPWLGSRIPIRRALYSSAAAAKAVAADSVPVRPGTEAAASSLLAEAPGRGIIIDGPLSETLNPPASTRPPPLTVPVRKANSSLPAHLYKLGKAYISFFRAGLKAVLVNYRLLAKSRKDAKQEPGRLNRATLLLGERSRHDIARLPLFGLIVLFTGEFSPLVVFLFPKLTPYTCRVPQHVNKLRRKAQERRAASYAALQNIKDARALDGMANAHIARVLGLGVVLWDKVGLSVPFAGRRVQRTLEKIVQDDFMIKEGGGVGRVHDEEVILAVEARGLDVRERDVPELRAWLGRWIDRTTKGNGSDGKSAIRMLLLEPRQHEV